MSMLGYAVASTAAYLGGHLVFGEQIGVDHTATADSGLPEKFTRVMSEKDLKENKPTKVLANGVAVLLVRRKDEIYALTETCPHAGGPLSEGKLVGDAIQCPARCFDVRVRSGHIEVRAQRV